MSLSILNEFYTEMHMRPIYPDIFMADIVFDKFSTKTLWRPIYS